MRTKNLSYLSYKVLKLFTQSTKPDPHGNHINNSFEVLEFENGLVVIEGEMTADRYFESIHDIEIASDFRLTGIITTGKTGTCSEINLVASIRESELEFGENSIPPKARKMLPR